MNYDDAIRYLNVEKQRCPTEFNIQKRHEVYDLAIYAINELKRKTYGCYDNKKSDTE